MGRTMEHERITTPCPTCGNTTLFIGTGGHLTCSLIGCPNPGVADAITRLQTKARGFDILDAAITAATIGYKPQQVIDRPNANAAGQRFAFDSARDAVRHGFIPPASQRPIAVAEAKKAGDIVPVTFPRESPDDPQSSRRRGSAGNFEELNAEVTGGLPAIDPKARE